MIATLQYQACVSSVCEKKIVSILITAVGKEQIDADLAKKVIIVHVCDIHMCTLYS